MNPAAANVVIGCTLTFIGAAILFLLGAVITYVRSINKSMKELLVMAVEHRTKIEMHDKQIDELFERFNKFRHN